MNLFPAVSNKIVLSDGYAMSSDTDDSDDDLSIPSINLDTDEESDNSDYSTDDDDEPVAFPAVFTNVKAAPPGIGFPTALPAAPFPTVTLPTTQLPTALPSAPFPTITLPTSPFPGVTAQQIPLPTTQLGGLKMNTLPLTTPPVTTLPVSTLPLTTLPVTTLPVSTLPLTLAGTALPVATIPIAAKPIIPIVAGLNTPTAPALAPTADAASLLEKLPGVTITTLTPAALQTNPDINDLLQKEVDESESDFEARRRLTVRLSELMINGSKINNATAVVIGFIMLKKVKLGLEYDPTIEATLRALQQALDPQTI